MTFNGKYLKYEDFFRWVEKMLIIEANYIFY